MSGEVPRSSVHTFCTVADLQYLPRTLVLYRSLESKCPGFRLHVVCMEPGMRRVLEGLRLPRAVVHDIDELEDADPDLRLVKPTRTRTEYCWTVKPTLCRYLLEREPDVGTVTYLDSDLMFLADPGLTLDELGDRSIMIVPHRFPPTRPEWAKLDGIYNGAWLTFRGDAQATSALQWWRERCLEWCYDRREDGKFADQHYLDDWPERFEGVHAIDNPGAGLAPWNGCRYRLERRDGRVLVDRRPVVFYHYQSLRLLRAPRVLRRVPLASKGYRFMRDPAPLVWWTAPSYQLSDQEVELLWRPYLKRLMEASAEVRAAEPGFDGGVTRMGAGELGGQLARRLVPRSIRRALRRPFAGGT